MKYYNVIKRFYKDIKNFTQLKKNGKYMYMKK